MIVRRRHTKNFTTIGNALFEDERLAADEVGILAFLLSRPDDWEIRRPALRRRWNIGPDSIKRIIHNWIKTGWCVAEKTRLSNGTFSIVYEIRDEPGPELSEEEVKRALSLVSSEAADDDSRDSSAPVASDPPEVCISPHSPKPGVDGQGVARGRWPIEGLPNTDDSNTDSTQAPLWTDARKAWPIGHMVSPFVCENLFALLTPENKKAAFREIVPYLADCRVKNRKVCDFSTYLREKRWEARPTNSGTAFPVKGGTPEAFRWLDYRREHGEPTTLMEECWRNGKPWYARSQWPPAKGPGDRTTPPNTQASPENEPDLSEFSREMGG